MSHSIYQIMIACITKHIFCNKPEQNTFLAAETPRGPICISVVVDHEAKEYKALIRTRDGTVRAQVPISGIKAGFFRKIFNLGPAPIDILKALDSKLPMKLLKLSKSPTVNTKVLELEEKQVIKGFKFGILYAAPHQTKEDEMFNNATTSDEFEEFLDFIGDRVTLNGWEHYRAGLDVKTGSTGITGLYCKWNNNEIMYHVSTLLPFNPKDKQQLERKRHIGNDIVVILFQEGDTVYRPTTISSRQVHVVFLVKVVQVEDDPKERYYRLSVISKDAVPLFGPPLENVSIHKKGPEFKELFYRKLLNAEKASYTAPIFKDKLERTRTALYADLARNHG